MRGQVWIVAAVAAMTAVAPSAPAQAQSYAQGGGYAYDAHCEQERQNRALWGAAIGGVAGALLGRELSARNARNSGTMLGGLAGAGAGAAIGHNSADCKRAIPQQTYDDRGQYGGGYQQGSAPGGWGYDQQPAYRTGESYPELHGGAGGGRNQDCRYGEVITRDPNGRELRDRIYMCRGYDGVWRPA